MTRLAWMGSAAIAAVQLAGAPVTQQAFRMTAETVVVMVSVRDASGRTPPLTAQDFEVEDNGVRQKVDQAMAIDLPLDATILIPIDWWRRPSPPAPAEIIAEELTRLSRDTLRPHDRLRVLTSGSVEETVGWRAGNTSVTVAPPRVLTGVTIADSLLYALSRPAAPGRRQVIVLFEDRDHDYGSALDPATLPALAANADATLYVVVGRPAWVPSKVNVVAQFVSRSGIDLGTSDLQIALRDAARATGGDAFAPATPALDFPRAFRDMLEDFRGSYLLGFTPSGDRRPGFHKLTVRVKNGNGLTIRARSGYFQK